MYRVLSRLSSATYKLVCPDLLVRTRVKDHLDLGNSYYHSTLGAFASSCERKWYTLFWKKNNPRNGVLGHIPIIPFGGKLLKQCGWITYGASWMKWIIRIQIETTLVSLHWILSGLGWREYFSFGSFRYFNCLWNMASYWITLWDRVWIQLFHSFLSDLVQPIIVGEKTLHNSSCFVPQRAILFPCFFLWSQLTTWGALSSGYGWYSTLNATLDYRRNYGRNYMGFHSLSSEAVRIGKG